MLLPLSDHGISDAAAFNATVANGVASVGGGELLTFGIKPEQPETGYDWLELASNASEVPVKLSRFKE